jgi:hypothetical protein
MLTWSVDLSPNVYVRDLNGVERTPCDEMKMHVVTVQVLVSALLEGRARSDTLVHEPLCIDMLSCREQR